MKKYLLLSLFFIAGVLLTSCNNWDDHYESSGSGAIPDKSIYEYLEAAPEYSKFLELMETTGVIEELKKNQVMTVWAVHNDNMPDNYNNFTDEELVRLAKHQINYMSIQSFKFAENKTIKTLSKKNVRFTKTVEDKFALDGKGTVKTDMLCKNGVIHEITDLIIPRDNAYEVIEKLSDDYSMLRDTILYYSEWVFDEENSFPIGVDQDGNTIYDTVWALENIFFDNSIGDFRNEDTEVTLFLYSNAVIENSIATIIEEFGGIEQLTEDELIVMNNWWIFAFLYKGYIYNYYENMEIYSVWGLLWRTDIQEVTSSNYTKGSNCLTYDVKKLHIPRNLFLEDILFDIGDLNTSAGGMGTGFYKLLRDHPNKDLLGQYIKHTPLGTTAYGSNVTLDATSSNSAGTGNTWFWLTMSNKSDPEDLWAEFTVLTLNSRGNVVPARFFPGVYDVDCSFRPWTHSPGFIYFNGEPKAQNVALSGTAWGSTNGAQIRCIPPLQNDGDLGPGKYLVKETGGLVIRVEIRDGYSDATEKRLVINGFHFYPNKSVY